MFCSQCGAKLSENLNFCPSCGNKITVNRNKDIEKTIEKKVEQPKSESEIAAKKTTERAMNTEPQKQTQKFSWVLFSVILIIILLINGRLIFPDFGELLTGEGNITQIPALSGKIAGWLLGSLFLVYILYKGINKINFNNSAAKKSFISGLIVIVVVLSIVLLPRVFLGNNQKINGNLALLNVTTSGDQDKTMGTQNIQNTNNGNAQDSNDINLKNYVESFFTTSECVKYFSFLEGEMKKDLMYQYLGKNNNDYAKCNIELAKWTKVPGYITCEEYDINFFDILEHTTDFHDAPSLIYDKIFQCSITEKPNINFFLFLKYFSDAKQYKIINQAT